VTAVAEGEIATSLVLGVDGVALDQVAVTPLPFDAKRADRNGFVMKINPANATNLLMWLRGLADGYVHVDTLDAYAKVDGGLVIAPMPVECDFAQNWLGKMPDTDASVAGKSGAELGVDMARSFFVGQSALAGDIAVTAKEPFTWAAPDAPLKTTTLHERHKKLGGVMVPFAGYDMPVRYESTIIEHNVVRQAAGLFDVSHMGVFDARGPRAAAFCDLVCSNSASGLPVGKAEYNYLMDHNAQILDDLLIYRLAEDHYLLVVNAANEEKDWAWVTAVNEGRVLLDPQVPHRQFGNPCDLRNLKDPKWGDECRVDIALQGPASRDVLMAIADDASKPAIKGARRNDVVRATLAGIDAIVSGTGYTGEAVAFEIFIDPKKAPQLWDAILEAGQDKGVKPVGLGARDSLRLEAGLPLYGQELAGPHGISPYEAAFGSFVKLHKPFFIGKGAYVAARGKRDLIVVRFGVPTKGNRPLKFGDPVINDRGACIGHVTSCATDGEGLLIGQAFIQKRYAAKGTDIQIMPAPAKGKPAPAAGALKVGNRLTLPVQAKVLSRFMAR
jgi:glycine hydroxymethyltransferase